MNENQASTPDTLTEILVEQRKTINELRERELNAYALMVKVRELEDRLADCAKQKNPETVPFAYIQATGDKICELQKSLASARAECKMWDHRELSLRKSLGELESRLNVRDKELDEFKTSLLKSKTELQEVYAALGKARTERDGLRKEKEHYEKVAQDMTTQVQNLKAHIVTLNEHSGYSRGYDTGRQNGRVEALAKVQDAVLKLRE